VKPGPNTAEGPARPADAERWDRTIVRMSVVIVALGLVVLVGWHARIGAAVQIVPGLTPMQYNTALCFLALGVGGIGLATRRRLLLVIGGSAAALMGAGVILEYATGASFGIDTLFFHPWIATPGVPGRMAAITAVSFALAGAALLIVAVRPTAYGVFGIVNSIPLSLALTSLISFIFEINYTLPFGLGVQMALHTAAGFILYGVATQGYAWTNSQSGPDGLPKWSAGIGGAFLPVLLIGFAALFPKQSWPVVSVEVVASVIGVGLIALTMRRLTTVKLVYKGLLMIAIPLILLLTFVGLVVHVKHESESAQAWALHSTEVLSASQPLLAHVAESESAVRGYVITGDDAFLASYASSSALVAQTTAALETLVIDNGQQEASAARVKQLVAQRMKRLTEVVQSIESGRRKEGEDKVKASADAALMKQIVMEMTAFSRTEEQLEAARRQALDGAWQRLGWLLVAGTVAAILLAAVLTLSFSGGVSKRLKRLQDNAIRLAAGDDLAERLTGGDEIADLDRVFHDMARSLDELSRRERAVIQGSTDGIVIKDLEHRYVLANQGSASLLGMAVDDIIGKTIHDLYEPDTAARILAFDDAIIAGGGTVTRELTAAKKGGESRTYSSTYSPYRDRHGTLVGVISVSRDITAQKHAEVALIESERRFRDLFYDAPVGYHELDIDGRITCVNTTELSMLGYAEDEMVGRHVWDFIDDADIARYTFAEKLRGVKPVRSVERSFRRKDGTFLPVQLDDQMLKDPNGRLIGIRATMQDITERKKAEGLLKAGALQSAIFNSANFSSIATDANGVVQIFNVGAERMLGYTAGEVMNQVTPADLSDPEELVARAAVLSAEFAIPITPGFEALVFKASRGIEDIYELTYFRKDGSRFPAVVSVTALRDARDAIIGYLLIGTDNTARKQVEDERTKLDQRLRDQQFYTRSLIESNIDALMTIDPSGIITDVNKETEVLTGSTRAELIGAPFKNYFTDAHRAEAGINRVLAEGKVTDYELTARARDETLTVVSYNATTFHDRDGHLQGVVAAARDMTEMKRFQRTLQQKNVQLEDASRMKSEFLANMSHELRTPLNAFIGFSEVLKDGLMGDMTARQRGFIGDIFNSGTHLLSLINDILDLSKVEAGKMELDLESVTVASLFANSISIIREKAAARQIRLVVERADDLGSIHADPRKVKQILYNLLSNAVKFTNEGGQVTVRTARVTRTSVGQRARSWAGRNFSLPESTFEDFIEISVTDTGIGVSPEGLARLFTPFSQIDSGLARRFEGTGLGLAMVKLLAELHCGTVAVESAVGEGSSFTIWLPLRVPGKSAASGAETPETLTNGEPLPGARIALVVEDDLRAAQLIRVQLEAEGFTVLHAATAETALALVGKQPLALITLDVMLPNMDGWEFLGRVKQMRALEHIPIVIISIVADRHKGFALGAAAVMQKPISRRDLHAALSDLALLPTAQGQTLRVLVVDDDPKAVELVAIRMAGLPSTVLRAFGGREAIAIAQRELPDVIVLDLMMPDVNGFDVVEELSREPATAQIPILIVTAKQITTDDRVRLNGFVTTIMEKGEFDLGRLTAEVRRAMAGRRAVA
jgi:PAS domain S-box-containing protein